jgi:putative DNA primase/helicase
MTELITTLRTKGPRLAKQWLDDGSIENYEDARNYSVHPKPVAGIHDLHTLLGALRKDPRRCIIRGKPKAGIDTDKVERRLFNFMDDRSRLFMLDVDNFQSLIYDEPWLNPMDVALEYVSTLPPEFHGVSFVLQLSGSCGHPSKGNAFKAHLWFWLKEPMFCKEAERYTQVKLAGLSDLTVHRTVQVNYTADPVMGELWVDTAPERLFFHQGWADDALTIEPLDPLEGDVTDVAPRMGRDGMVDPREKPGVIGAVCRAFSPEQIVDLFPETFRAGSTERRITWLAGGGTPEGLCVTDNGTHLFNSHSTAPVTHACNIFDFIRIHVFGYADEGLGAGVAELDVTATRSYELAKAWALTMPEVQAELHSEEAVEVAHVHAEKVADKKEQQLELVETKLDNLQALVASMNSLAEMETKLFPRVQAARGLTPTQRDLLVGLVKDRSKALGIKLSLPAIRESLKPAVGTEGATVIEFADVDAQGNPKCTIGNVQALCARLGVTIRYNVITKRQEILGPECTFSADNYDNATLAWLQSECAKVGIPYGASVLKGYITAIADQNQFNPVQVWLESKDWDGVDRLPALYATIQHDPEFDKALKERMIRKWMIQAVAAACSPVPLQLRGVLVISGDQYQGKSRWLQSLVPGHGDFAILGRTLDAHNKDSIKTAISHWLCELGELDATFSKSDMAALKSFLAQDMDRFRLPYASADSTFQRRSVFYGSVNGGQFLTDGTGNTRMWVIPSVGMDPEHGLDMQQVWAQVLELWRAGEAHWMTKEEMEQVNTSSESFTIEDPLAYELRKKFAWDAARVEPEKVTWVPLCASEVLLRLGRRDSKPGTATRVGQMLAKLCKPLGLKVTRTSKANLWPVPYLSQEAADADEFKGMD